MIDGLDLNKHLDFTEFADISICQLGKRIEASAADSDILSSSRKYGRSSLLQYSLQDVLCGRVAVQLECFTFQFFPSKSYLALFYGKCFPAIFKPFLTLSLILEFASRHFDLTYFPRSERGSILVKPIKFWSSFPHVFFQVSKTGAFCRKSFISTARSD